MSKFDPVVWDAAEVGDIDTLVSALTLHPYLIDAPHFRERRQTPMFIAAQNGHVGIVSKLVELGSRAIDTPDNSGSTPMHAAASNGRVSVIMALVRLGSQAIDTPNKYGWTPMIAAAMHGHVSVVETLVRLGSMAIDTPDNYDYTPMIAAASKGHVSVVETLVRLGSMAIDTPDNYGWTPVCFAAHHGSTCLKTLKLLGADCAILSASSRSDISSDLLDEDESLSIRYNVYFHRSLSSRLLFEVAKQK